jgi:hypothetical protein
MNFSIPISRLFVRLQQRIVPDGQCEGKVFGIKTQKPEDDERAAKLRSGPSLNQREATITRSVRPTTAVTVLASEIASAELCAHAVHCDCCGSSFLHRFTGK